jgi:hypothetical protein
MSPSVPRPGFLEGVLVALSASLLGGLLFAVLAPVATPAAALRTLIATVGLAYLLYLLRRAPVRVGRVTVGAASGLVAMAVWLAAPAPVEAALAYLALVWGVRCLYFHSSLFAAAADLGLNALSLAAAAWALQRTGSLSLGLWCLFLAQALFVFIPPARWAASGEGFPPGGQDRFQHALRRAEEVLRSHSHRL